jgi:rare lipoprotein A
MVTGCLNVTLYRSREIHQRERDGALEVQPNEARQLYVVPRRRFAVAAWLTLFAAPLLVLDNVPRTDANADAAKVATAGAAASAPSTAPSATYPAPTEAPAATLPSVTAAAPTPATVAPIRSVAKPAPAPSVVTTTTKPPPPPTTAPPPPPPNAEAGGASWYDYRAGECAHQTLAKGTVVSIANVANGASTMCVVTDRGPFGAGRIIDLDRATFAQLADPSVGIIQVHITW